MKHLNVSPWFTAPALALSVLFAVPTSAQAVVPLVRTVPWVAADPKVPHETYPNKSITLKGTTNLSAHWFQAKWNFGDGTPDAIFAVADMYDVSTTHIYNGPVGKQWTARLTVTDIDTGDSGSSEYYVVMRENNLKTRANVAVDEGLWYLHRTMQRYVPGVVPQGDWDQMAPSFCNQGDQACDDQNNSQAINASNVLAFEMTGHRENGPATDPYTETVARALGRLFTQLKIAPIPKQKTIASGAPASCKGSPCIYNPDGNGNGWAIFVDKGTDGKAAFYQAGQFIDAIVASGTPGAKVMIAAENIAGRSYKEVVQDLADGYSYCRFSANADPSWTANCEPHVDSSVAQWARTGLSAAVNSFAISVPPLVMDADRGATSSDAGMATVTSQYAALVSQGQPSDSMAGAAIARQNPVGFWAGHLDATGDRRFETAWSIILLQKFSLHPKG